MLQIKDCFTSRGNLSYGACLLELDYSQLEVIGAAIISGDVNMHEDIVNGVDAHSQSASWSGALEPYHGTPVPNRARPQILRSSVADARPLTGGFAAPEQSASAAYGAFRACGLPRD